jgi:hypothetical protein
MRSKEELQNEMTTTKKKHKNKIRDKEIKSPVHISDCLHVERGLRVIGAQLLLGYGKSLLVHLNGIVV